MSLFGNGKKIPRQAAMTAIPVRLPTKSRKELPNDGLRLTVMQEVRGLMSWFGAKREYEKSFNLDYLGVQVYEACNGKARTQKIVEKFAERNNFALAESEMSVTMFLKTMMSRGLIAMKFEE
jgi:hypothetical protein